MLVVFEPVLQFRFMWGQMAIDETVCTDGCSVAAPNTYKKETYVKVSPASPSPSLTRNRTPTPPLLPIYPGPHPVHAVSTSDACRATPSSRPYTSSATPTLTTFAMSE